MADRRNLITLGTHIFTEVGSTILGNPSRGDYPRLQTLEVSGTLSTNTIRVYRGMSMGGPWYAVPLKTLSSGAFSYVTSVTSAGIYDLAYNPYGFYIRVTVDQTTTATMAVKVSLI